MCPSHHQSAKTQSLDLETVAGMYVVILCGALMSMLLCSLQYCYSQLRRKRKQRIAKNKDDDSLKVQELGDEFKRPDFMSIAADNTDRSSNTNNHDEITYANHSPLHYRTAADWT
ncbi:unnamed protein product [Lymnaea stagnalis]|uniref:Uncharacterized protein n=1 Tax=Lymnaea stagnalis TaxID=6523 RepID=A0AAV2IA93_LYMST